MPPPVLEAVPLPLDAVVVERDGHARVEERQLAQPLGERVEAELNRLEDHPVREEADLRPALLRLAGDLDVGHRVAVVVHLVVDQAVAPNLEVERLGEGVHHRDADAVQAARHLVAVVVELPPGVEDRHHDLGRRPPALVHVDRDAAAVVDHRDRVVEVDRDVDRVAEAGERLVDRVVHHLVDQVVEPLRSRRADVHGGTLADRLEPLEDLDLVSSVLVHVEIVGHHLRRVARETARLNQFLETVPARVGI